MKKMFTLLRTHAQAHEGAEAGAEARGRAGARARTSIHPCMHAVGARYFELTGTRHFVRNVGSSQKLGTWVQKFKKNML